MKNLTIKINTTIKEAMKLLDKTAEKCLLVIDDNNKLLGTLTDGDLRRSILAGLKNSDKIESSYNGKPTILIKNKYNKKDAKKLLRELRIDLIPIVDNKKNVIDYFTWSDFGKEKKLNPSINDVPVVIMAGGKGNRLKPFTNILPKPLIPIHDKTVIEHIIESFTDIGCSNFYLSINYKGKLLKAYFDELNPKYHIDYITEPHPLGTAGSLKLLQDKINQPFFVTNCDIIVKTDYARLYKYHNQGNYDITLVASTKEYIIPYGTCELNDQGSLQQINEKPQYDFLVNTGLYLVNTNILSLIPKNKFYHITELIKDAKKLGKNIGVFPIDDDSWTDIGQWAEYKKALDSL